MHSAPLQSSALEHEAAGPEKAAAEATRSAVAEPPMRSIVSGNPSGRSARGQLWEELHVHDAVRALDGGTW